MSTAPTRPTTNAPPITSRLRRDGDPTPPPAAGALGQGGPVDEEERDRDGPRPVVESEDEPRGDVEEPRGEGVPDLESPHDHHRREPDLQPEDAGARPFG